MPFDIKDYPGLSSFQDRHEKTRWRYRSKGRTVALVAPDHPAFEEAYAAAVEGRKTRRAAVVPLPGAALPQTFGAAYRQLVRTAKWLSYDSATRLKNTRLIEEFLDRRIVPDHATVWRNVPAKSLRRSHVEELLAGFLATPHKAKHLLVAIRKLVRIALREGWIDSDPTHLIEWRPAYAGWKAWRVEAMKQFEQKHPAGTAARTCYGLALWLGDRRSDVARLRWDERVTKTVLINGRTRRVDGFEFTQQKGREKKAKKLFVPITPMLAEILDAAPRSDKCATVLMTAYEKPFSEKSLTGAMAYWTHKADLPAGLTLHGLRKSLGVYLAESEASTRQLMDILGHDDIEHAELYSREASQIRLAVQGMDRVTKLVTRKQRG